MPRSIRSRPALTGGAILICMLLVSPLTGVSGDPPGPIQPDQLVAVVAGSAGGPTGSETLHVDGTVGQPTPIGRAQGSGRVLYAGFWAVRQAIVTGVETPASLPLDTRLMGNAPNPFNPATSIRFTLAAAGPVRLDVFDARGQHVRTLVDGFRPAGRHEVLWRGDDAAGRRVASGVYFCRLRADRYQAVRKMLMLK